MADKQITCYPTYGFKDSDGTWKISMRVLVYESRALESVLERLLEPGAVDLAEQFSHHGIDRSIASKIFKERIAYFLREGVEKKEIVFKFHDGTNTNSYTVDGLTTDKDGLITADITLDPRKASRLSGQVAQSFTYHAPLSAGAPS